jgi:hypothetical protein
MSLLALTGIPSGYVQALVDYADVFGTKAVQEIKDELEVLFAKMKSEDGKTAVNSSVNGRNFGFEVTMTVEQKFAAFVRAYKLITGDAGSSCVTFIDFSQSSGGCSSQPLCLPW